MSQHRLAHPHRRFPSPTGHQVVVFKPGVANAADLLHEAGKKHRADFALSHMAEGEHLDAQTQDHAVHFDELGIAIIGTPHLESGHADAIAEHLRGHEHVRSILPDHHLFVGNGPDASVYRETHKETWGMQAVEVPETTALGRGISVAVLDTGIDADHPAFRGRIKASRSFVPKETVHDGNGHGTHCAGTIAGRHEERETPRYGIAPEAHLIIGKIMANNGYGHLRWILSGMRWALSEKADIISMSVAGPMPHHVPYYEPYQRLATRALDQGTLIVAAAGNASDRSSGQISPIGMPASSPDVLAIGAVDNQLRVAPFSNGEIDGHGKAIDLCGPGLFVFSTYPAPRHYNILSGTSMACPHVAGIAALYAERDHGLRGRALRDALIKGARKLDDTPANVGHGLAQAPA